MSKRKLCLPRGGRVLSSLEESRMQGGTLRGEIVEEWPQGLPLQSSSRNTTSSVLPFPPRLCHTCAKLEIRRYFGLPSSSQLPIASSWLIRRPYGERGAQE